MRYYENLYRLIESKKSEKLKKEGQYFMEVAMEADKLSIAKAVKFQFDVEVEKVRVLIRRGKVYRKGTKLTRPKSRKFAYVTLKPGYSLSDYYLEERS